MAVLAMDVVEPLMGMVMSDVFTPTTYCEQPGCAAEEIVWEGNPDEDEKPTDELPTGWVQRGDQAFCPEHA
jgi:hypothetical protein